MIELYHVCKMYGRSVVALDDVSFRVEKGEFVFLTGPSGAGKSTLLKLLFMAEEATRGQILVATRNITRLSLSGIPILRRNIGVVFQDFRLLGDRTVAQNVGLPLHVQGVSARQIRAKVASVLDAVGLLGRAAHYPYQLSGGEQQRVAVARALVHTPPILLADEPTGNLDPELTRKVMDCILHANVQGTTVLFATHDQHLMQTQRRRVISLQGGRIVADTPGAGRLSGGNVLPGGGGRGGNGIGEEGGAPSDNDSPGRVGRGCS